MGKIRAYVNGIEAELITITAFRCKWCDNDAVHECHTPRGGATFFCDTCFTEDVKEDYESYNYTIHRLGTNNPS